MDHEVYINLMDLARRLDAVETQLQLKQDKEVKEIEEVEVVKEGK